MSQRNARIHAAATVIVVVASLTFRVTAMEAGLLVCVSAMVWATEAINTALECLADHVSPGYAELVGRCKDLAAGAVLIAAIASVIVGCLIFLPRLR